MAKAATVVHTARMLYDAYCFDLDGTLWDAIEATVVAWNRVATRYELRTTPITRRDLEGTTGRPIAECVRNLLGEALPVNLEDLIEEIEVEEARCIDGRSASIYPGVQAVVAELSGSRPLFIVSNCQAWYIERFFEISGLADHFTAWNCHGHAGEEKGVMVSDFAIDRGRTIYVGDTITDQRAAEFAGVDFGYAAYGFGQVERFDLRLERFGDLLAG